MAADDGPRRLSASSSLGSWLVLALAIVTGYAAWQIAPLAERIDALERQSLGTRDRTLAEIERLNSQIAALRPAPIANEQASKPTAATSPAPAPTAAAAPVPKPAAVDPTAYIDAHLVPGDAAIARAMLSGTTPQDIARSTQHSPAFVLARGAQIEKMLSAAPGAPRELVRALQDYLRNHRP